MPLEATMICLDNSEWMRNGDFVPTRLQSQKDAVHVVCNAKLRSHGENTFGVLTMSGKRTSVLMNLTSDIGRIISGIHNIPYEGECDLLNAVQVAQLALKHRQNKQQAQRIVVFVGSPLAKADKEELVKLGKRLKKNNIALDIINFGETEENRDKLEAFVKAVDNDGNSHIISVPAGPQIILSDVLRQSPIISATASGASGASETPGGGFDFDVDPTMDPELAMALKMSYEEEKARQEAQKKTPETKEVSAPATASSAAPTSTSVPASTPTSTPSTTPATAPSSVPSSSADVDMYEDDEIAQAIALSMKTKAEDDNKPQATPSTPVPSAQSATPSTASTAPISTPTSAPAPTATSTSTPAPTEVAMTDLDDEDEELKLAMQLSLQAPKTPAPTSTAASGSTGSSDLTQQAIDSDFMKQLLTTLPGVDVNDPSIQNVLASFQGGEKKEEKKEDKK